MASSMSLPMSVSSKTFTYKPYHGVRSKLDGLAADHTEVSRARAAVAGGVGVEHLPPAPHRREVDVLMDAREVGHARDAVTAGERDRVARRVLVQPTEPIVGPEIGQPPIEPVEIAD